MSEPSGAFVDRLLRLGEAVPSPSWAIEILAHYAVAAAVIFFGMYMNGLLVDAAEITLMVLAAIITAYSVFIFGLVLWVWVYLHSSTKILKWLHSWSNGSVGKFLVAALVYVLLSLMVSALVLLFAAHQNGVVS